MRLTLHSLKQLLLKMLGAFFLLSFFLGVMLLVVAPYELYRLHTARDWPYREGTISQSTVHQSSGSRHRKSWQPLLRGRFHDTGEGFVITRIHYGDFLFGETHSKTQAARYPVGSRVKVYYSPENPREMLLEPQASTTPAFIALGTGAALVALPFLLYLLGRVRSATP